MMIVFIKNDEFCIKNDEFCIKDRFHVEDLREARRTARGLAQAARSTRGAARLQLHIDLRRSCGGGGRERAAELRAAGMERWHTLVVEAATTHDRERIRIGGVLAPAARAAGKTQEIYQSPACFTDPLTILTAMQWGEQPAEHLIVMGGQDSYWTVHKDGERLRIGPSGAMTCSAEQTAARSAAAGAVDSSLSKAEQEEAALFGGAVAVAATEWDRADGWSAGPQDMSPGYEGGAGWLQPLPEARKWTAMVTASLAW